MLTEYIELGYISPDWKVDKDVNLQQICVELAADFLEIKYSKFDDLKDIFMWLPAPRTGGKNLLVKKNKIPKQCSTKKFLRDTELYILGLFMGIGYV
jgi:hypothetical protein